MKAREIEQKQQRTPYLFIGMVFFIFLSFLLVQIYAPVPPWRNDKKIIREELTGQWIWIQYGKKHYVILSRDGNYICVNAESTWIGSWKFEDGILTIWERHQSKKEGLDNLYTFSVTRKEGKPYLEGWKRE